jgi:hypothetical protein
MGSLQNNRQRGASRATSAPAAINPPARRGRPFGSAIRAACSKYSVEAGKGRFICWTGGHESVQKPPVVAAIRILIERVVIDVAETRDPEKMVV